MQVKGLKRAIKSVIPEPLLEWRRRRLHLGTATQKTAQPQLTTELPEWEFRDHWNTDTSIVRGWNVASIARTQVEKWPAFVALVEGTGPLGISHEAPANAGRESLWAHNLLASYAYCVTLASRSRNVLSMLDWGGGIGHYFLFTKAVLPDVDIEYYCQEVPVLCEAGRANLPDAHFIDEPDACFQREYDFVHAGSSLWCCHDWRVVAAKLAVATQGYLYITRMMFVDQADSFVAIQRPQKYGYDTEYQCWILNRGEFVEYMESLDLTLVREFFFGPGPVVSGAQEQGVFRGFLFRKDQ